jgi:hypothetical protein
MHNRFSILSWSCLATLSRPYGTAGHGPGGFKGEHYKEFGAQIAPFIAFVTGYGDQQHHPIGLTKPNPLFSSV